MKKDRRIKDNIIKDIRNLFRKKKEKVAIKGRKIRNVKSLFELEKEEEKYCKPLRVGNF